ncbi:hypothetical protein Afe04nite_09550 [Asanoa ferruginea]|nr:hypothetical protein Afe04nite_09550 [Asanoa ferruginea]
MLVELAGEALPAPDPYGRLHARHRRVRRRRAIAAGLGLIVVMAVTAVVLSPGGGGGPTTDNDDTNPAHSMNQWSERMRETPTRGQVATADPAYVDELTRLLAQHQRAGDYEQKAGVSEVNVVFLDDVGDARVALVAFHLASPAPVTGYVNSSAWFAAPRGASAAEVAGAAATASFSSTLDPFMIVSKLGKPDGTNAGAAVALVPEGCVVESAPLPAVSDWKPEPTGSYLVRTTATERAEWWRAICDGVVRDSQPAPTVLPPEEPKPLTDAEVDAALEGARGQVDRQLASAAVRASTQIAPNQLSGPVRVLWGGQIAGAKPDDHGSWDGTGVLTAAPAAPSGWQVDLHIASPAADNTLRDLTGSWMPDDPTSPTAVVPMRFGGSDSVLVVAPDGAKAVRAVHDGSIVDTADVNGLAAVVDAPDSADLVFEAVDAGGTVLGSGRIPNAMPTVSTGIGW